MRFREQLEREIQKILSERYIVTTVDQVREVAASITDILPAPMITKLILSQLLDELEEYGFECEAGNLKRTLQFQALRELAGE